MSWGPQFTKAELETLKRMRIGVAAPSSSQSLEKMPDFYSPAGVSTEALVTSKQAKAGSSGFNGYADSSHVYDAFADGKLDFSAKASIQQTEQAQGPAQEDDIDAEIFSYDKAIAELNSQIEDVRANAKTINEQASAEKLANAPIRTWDVPNMDPRDIIPDYQTSQPVEKPASALTEGLPAQQQDLFPGPQPFKTDMQQAAERLGVTKGLSQQPSAVSNLLGAFGESFYSSFDKAPAQTLAMAGVPGAQAVLDRRNQAVADVDAKYPNNPGARALGHVLGGGISYATQFAPAIVASGVGAVSAARAIVSSPVGKMVGNLASKPIVKYTAAYLVGQHLISNAVRKATVAGSAVIENEN